MLAISDIYTQVAGSVERQDLLSLGLCLERLRQGGMDFSDLEQHYSILSYVFVPPNVKNFWNKDIVYFLIENGAKFLNKEGKSNLLFSGLRIVPDLADMLEKFCSAEDLKVLSEHGKSMLTLFAANDRTTVNSDFLIMDSILSKGIDINYPNADGTTALMVTCDAEKDLSVKIKYLVDKGADMYAKDSNGRSVISYALSNSSHVRTLVELGLSITTVHDYGQTTLLQELLDLAVYRHDREAYEICTNMAKVEEPLIQIPSFEEATGVVRADRPIIEQIKNLVYVDEVSNIDLRVAIIEYVSEKHKLIENISKSNPSLEEKQILDNVHDSCLKFLSHVIEYGQEVQFVRKALGVMAKSNSMFALLIAGGEESYPSLHKLAAVENPSHLKVKFLL